MLPYGVFLPKTRLECVSTGRKASLSAQSCNLYRSFFFFFLTRFGLEFRIQAKSIQGGGLGLHLENCSLVDIHVRILFIILRGCHIIQIGFRVVRRSLPPECWNYRLTETPPKAVKGSGFFCGSPIQNTVEVPRLPSLSKLQMRLSTYRALKLPWSGSLRGRVKCTVHQAASELSVF